MGHLRNLMPAAFSMLLSVPMGKSPGCIGTVTRPDLVGWRYWACEPFVRTRSQPSGRVHERSVRGAGDGRDLSTAAARALVMRNEVLGRHLSRASYLWVPRAEHDLKDAVVSLARSFC